MAGGGQAASWWDWAMGLLVVVWDALSQRIASVTLPPRLPVTPLSHLTCIVTSCSPGIALETAKHLAESGARVVFAVADADAARELIASWEGDHVDGVAPLNCEVMEMDLLSLDSVRIFAVNWEARGLPLNVLINIGSTSCMDGPQERVSKDGFEQHMHVNYLAPALLTLLLLPSLLRGSPSRVVMVNSVVHHLGHLDFEDLNLSGNKKRHSKLTSYANSKLAQLLFSNLLQRRLPREAGVDIICVHPGQVTTEAATGSRGILQKLPSLYLLSPVEGARSVLFCATDEQVQDYARALRGLSYPLAPYFGSDCKPCSVARQVHDTDKANLVWQETLALVGMPVECVEATVSDCDPPDVDFNDIKYMESFPAVRNGEDFEFLLENGDDVDDFFHGADDN